MSWRWLFSPWISIGITLAMVAVSAIVFLVTGMIFIFFILPIPFVFWGLGRRNRAA